MNQVDRLSAIIAACLLSALGAMVYNILPMFLGVAQDVRGYSDQQLGFITSVYFTGFSVVTISAFFWIRKVNWKTASMIAACLVVTGLLASAGSARVGWFMLCVFIVGSGSSALYGVATTMLGDTRNAARSFGLKIGMEAGLGSILFFLLPSLVIARWGFDGMLYAGALVALVLAVAIVWLPAGGVKGQETAEQAPSMSWKDMANQLPMWFCLLGIFVFFGGVSSIWAFLERLGNDAGYSSGAISTALSLALIGAMAGSFLAAAIGNRYRLAPPLFIAAGVYLAAMVLLAYSSGVLSFTAAALLFAIAFGFALPFMVTVVSDLDTSGRFIVLTVPALALGGVAGPAIAGMVKTGTDYTPIIAYASVTVIVSLVLFLYALRVQRAKGPLTVS